MRSLASKFTGLTTSSSSPKVYQALYDFVPQAAAELGLRQGDLVHVLRDLGDGWTEVTLPDTGRTGAVPSSYIAPASSSSSSAPPPLAVVSKAQSLANEHNECSICCEDMPSLPCAVLLASPPAGSKLPAPPRACRHYLHTKCAEMLINSGQNTCPTCRAPFTSVLPVPDLATSPREWFKVVDCDGNGQLSKSEVMDLIRTFLPGVELARVEREFDSMWRVWDKDGSGEVSFAELCDPVTGLMGDFKRKFQPTSTSTSARSAEPPQLAVGTLRQWFEFWDEDGSRSLDKDEVIRALIKTFHLSTLDLYKVAELRDTVNNIWGAFDFDGSGEISLDEFVQREVGLGESLVASLGFYQQQQQQQRQSRQWQ